MTPSRWVGVMALMVMIGIAVPFTLLSQVHAWYGSFLLWAVMGVVVIAFNVLVTRRFHGPTHQPDQESAHE